MQRVDSLEKTLMLGGIEGKRRRGRQRMRWMDSITDSVDMSLRMEFSRQEYWSGLLFPSPGDLPHPGIEPGSPALQANSLPSEPPEKSQGKRRDGKRSY